MEDREWLGISEASRFTGKSTEHIRFCCRKGTLEHRRRLNGHIEIHIDVLRERFGEAQVAVAA